MRRPPQSKSSVLPEKGSWPLSSGRSFNLAKMAWLVAGIATWVGCQGLSEGPSTSQPKSGTFSLGSTALAFGNVVSGSNKTLTLNANNSGNASLTINSVASSSQNFLVTSPTFPATLAAGNVASITVEFKPNAAANFNGTLTFTTSASTTPSTVSLTGTGTAQTTAGQLSSSPTSEAFGNVKVGSQQSQTFTISNTGGSVVNISQAAVSGSGFQLSGITLPVTLNASQSTTLTVTFQPQTSGAASGSLTITSDASNGSLSIPLSGSGVASGALGSSPSSLSFGSETVGHMESLTETVTNTGGSTLTISQVGVSGTAFSFSGITTPVSLTAGQTASFKVSFDPSSAGSASGTLTLTSNGSNPSLSVPLTGTGLTAGALTPNPASISFGSETVGQTSTLSETVTNTGGSSISISQVAVSGTGFGFSGISTPLTLTSGQGATFNVSFDPTAAGSASGSLTITSTASNPSLAIPLSGTGVAPVGTLTATPGTIAIGSVVVGLSGSGSGTLSASGASVKVTGASSNNSAFSISGLSLPVTIAAGSSVPYTVTFDPSATGAATATLTFSSNAQPATVTQSATGTGTAAPTHSVNLSWTASTSPDISGYNVYRAPYASSCGSYSKINPDPITTTVYTDSSVTDGNSYCYASTALNSSDEESGYSNIVSNVQIPAP
jgi:Abnormal spindle-like microcephaly-assoc'd, ASPM-SPD-2-Hydin/Protein of unknown function (DUF1573)